MWRSVKNRVVLLLFVKQYQAITGIKDAKTGCVYCNKGQFTVQRSPTIAVVIAHTAKNKQLVLAWSGERTYKIIAIKLSNNDTTKGTGIASIVN
ncbi:hypothetical protein AHAT_18750 [Agarivorans sp. Toyoura001]|nr:hypothetical protein AHAT_18750 [Agarivorans sp. Toyoura001]